MALISKVVVAACLLAVAGFAAAQTSTGIVPGLTSQLCPTLNNPYGIQQVQNSAGTLIKSAMLVSTWNDPVNNNPGAGNIIWQCQLNGQVAPWANISLPSNSNCLKDGAGIGVTMALTICGNVVIVGSTPIKDPATGIASPGCLIALDQNGKFIADVKSPDINGPWGSTCSYDKDHDKITLFVSSVLGGLSGGGSSQNGRKMLQSASGGLIARFTFNTPSNGNFNLGQGTILVSGIKTNATGIGGGSVGPGNPTLSDEGILYFPSFFDNSIGMIQNAASTNANPNVVMTGIPGLNGPNSLFYTSKQLLGANTLDGNLFTVALNGNHVPNGNAVLTLVDPGNNAGVLFNAIIGADGKKYFVHDGTNTLNVVTGNQAPPPSTTPPSTSTLCTSKYAGNPCFCSNNYCFNFAASSTNNMCATPQGKTCHADTLTNPGQQLGAAYSSIKAGGSVCNCS